MKVIWNDKVLADSEETVFIEGNHYFPPNTVDKAYLINSDLTTECFWKGTANYYNLTDGENVAENAAWYYAQPKEGSEEKVKHEFKDYIAFYPQYVTITQ